MKTYAMSINAIFPGSIKVVSSPVIAWGLADERGSTRPRRSLDEPCAKG